MAEAGILTDGHRVELIDGDVIDMAAIGSPHAAVANRLVISAAVEICRKPKDSAYGSRGRLAHGPLSPALISGVTIEVAGLPA